MINSFNHKGLQKFFETGSSTGVQPAHKQKLGMRLAALDTATMLEDIDLPGFRLHPLIDRHLIAGITACAVFVDVESGAFDIDRNP